MTSIVIGEDHRIFAESLAAMLSMHEGLEVVGIAPSGSAIVDLVLATDPDVVLMDIKLDGINGIEATRRIVKNRADTKVLMLSMHDDDATVTDAIAAGAAGFLPKTISAADLVTAIRAIANGKGVLHPDVTLPFLTRVGGLADDLAARARLTERELEVLQHLADGMSTKQIAEDLVLSEETIKSHLSHIYRKLGVEDRLQAVATALRQGLVR